MPWEEVARRVGLSVKETQRIGEQAMRKLRILLLLEGVTRDVVRDYRRIKENE
jgi:hypothetical protein